MGHEAPVQRIYSAVHCRCCGCDPHFISLDQQVILFCDECEAVYFTPQDFEDGTPLKTMDWNGKIRGTDFKLDLKKWQLASHVEINQAGWHDFEGEAINE